MQLENLPVPPTLAAIGVALTLVGSGMTYMETSFVRKDDFDYRYYELLIGVNEIRMQNYESKGVSNLSDEELRKYESLKAAGPKLEALMYSSQ